MTEGYLQIMAESLEKKNQVLSQVLELDYKQLELATTQPIDMKAYDEMMQEKGKLIEELEQLDDGFTNTYELVKDEVQSDPDKYREQVLVLQDLIREAVEKGVEVEAQEKRNKDALSVFFQRRHTELKQLKKSSLAAVKYYKAMSRMNYIDPQLMDRKK